jgi:hypothetical protein
VESLRGDEPSAIDRVKNEMIDKDRIANPHANRRRRQVGGDIDQAQDAFIPWGSPRRRARTSRYKFLVF